MYQFERTYDNVIIIGNGFDLNLELPTSYHDFLESSHFSELFKETHFIAQRLYGSYKSANWIDIENELKEISTNSSGEVEKEFDLLKVKLMNYMGSIDYSLINKTSNAYKFLKAISSTNFVVLDYNYTESVEIILKELGMGASEISGRVIKVHGSAKNRDIIFGVEDRAKIEDEHLFLQKSYNSNYTGINLADQISGANTFYIWGHSLGETDHTYFAKFFQILTKEVYEANNQSIVLYHYGLTGYLQLLRQLKNLTDDNIALFKQQNNFHTIDSSVNT